MNTSQERRWSAVSKLQKSRNSMVEGSFAYDCAERAIDLLLNPRRRIDDYAVRRAWQNARYLEIREKHASDAPRFVADVYEDDYKLPIQSDTEENLAAEEFTARLRERVAKKHTQAPRCLDGLLRGYTQDETAQELNMSSSQVWRLKGIIRSSYSELLAEGGM